MPLADLFEGLESNNLLHLYSHLLTGYIGNASFLRQVAKIVKKLRETNPNLIYGKCMIFKKLFTYHKIEKQEISLVLEVSKICRGDSDKTGLIKDNII